MIPPSQRLWSGIRSDVTDVATDFGVTSYQFNTYMAVAGELQRRPGFQNTTIAKQSGPIRYIMGAVPTNNPFVVFDVLAAGVINVIGNAPPPIPRQPPRKRRPGAAVCTRYSRAAAGTIGAAINFTLPANTCSGTIAVVGTESPSRIGADYGYTFTLFADGAPLLATGCLVNAGAGGSILAGTLLITGTVTGGCAGGVTAGSWSLTATSP